MTRVRVAFLGDVVGQPGRRVIEQQIGRLRDDYGPDYIIANAENARAGSGLTPSIYARLRACGVHGITLGDHAFRDRKIVDLLQDPKEPVCRPGNLSRHAPGKRWMRIESTDGKIPPLFVVTVLGRVFMPLPANDPFACAVDALEEPSAKGAITLVEAHMEATGEKAALAHHLRGLASAVVGTHTHVATADERIIGGTAFISDVGMCGPQDSILGRDVQAVVRHMTTSVHLAYGVAEHDPVMNGVVVDVDSSTRHAVAIQRIRYEADVSRPPFAH